MHATSDIQKGMHTKQIPIRLSADMLADLDALVASGTYRSRAAAIRAGIKQVVHSEQQRRIDQEIVEGYVRHPPTEAEEQAAFDSIRDAINEEPW